jgi:hypothetical protein
VCMFMPSHARERKINCLNKDLLYSLGTRRLSILCLFPLSLMWSNRLAPREQTQAQGVVVNNLFIYLKK